MVIFIVMISSAKNNRLEKKLHNYCDSYLLVLALTCPVAIINRNSLASHTLHKISHG